jgi:hypothetical protein
LSRKLENREDVRPGGTQWSQPFSAELRNSRKGRKIQRIIDRYLLSAGDCFFPPFRPEDAWKQRGSINIAGGIKSMVKTI